MLSKYQQQIIKDNNFFTGRNKKLIPNQNNRTKYKS